MSKLEVQLFYVDDQDHELESVVSSFKDNRAVKKTRLIEICAESIVKKNPSACVTLVTDMKSFPNNNFENLEIVRINTIQPQSLLFDLNLYRRNYIRERTTQEDRIFFTDIDVLVNCDLNLLFEHDFDIQTSIDSQMQGPINKQGLPLGHMGYRFTGGGFFVKCNERSLNFFDEYLALWRLLAERSNFETMGKYSSLIKRDFLKWWGEIHTFSAMAGVDALSGLTDSKTISGCKFRFLDEVFYNYAPNNLDPYGDDLNFLDQYERELLKKFFDKKSIIHFRGNRKKYMPQIYDLING